MRTLDAEERIKLIDAVNLLYDLGFIERIQRVILIAKINEAVGM